MSTDRHCCTREDFDDGFLPEYLRCFGMPPNEQAKRNATRDWKAGNTGWEAARNAVNRVKDRARRATYLEWVKTQHATPTATSRTGGVSHD